MNDSERCVNTIIIKNLPKDYTENQLEKLFSKFGRITSSTILPIDSNLEGSYGFINYAEPESCTEAVEKMNNYVIDQFTLYVNHSSAQTNNNLDQPRIESHVDDEPNYENNSTSSPSIQNPFSSFQSATTHSSTTSSQIYNNTSLNTNEFQSFLNSEKLLWNTTDIEEKNNQSLFKNKTTMNICEHNSFVTNKKYSVYLSNFQLPNIIFVATLDDCINSTILITKMNKRDQLLKTDVNSYNSKLIVGQYCAALFEGYWYRARILEINKNLVQVQYIDMGNMAWCDSILEIQPLLNECYKDPVLCIKCVLDGVPTQEKLCDEQTNAILKTFVFDIELEMTVLRFENNLPYVQLNLGERNLNIEIQTILLQPSSFSTTILKKLNHEIISFDSNKPEMNISEIHSVQLIGIDTDLECFHVLLINDYLLTIMNVLKEWNVNKHLLTIEPKPNMLICAQDGDDNLWYRAWIQNIIGNDFCVYFVDSGNKKVVSIDRLSDCPEVLRNIPWQSIQIKLAEINLTDDERYLLLNNFGADRLQMKIFSNNQNIYFVELIKDEKSLSTYILNLRKKKEKQAHNPPITNETLKNFDTTQQFVVQAAAPPPIIVAENAQHIVKQNVMNQQQQQQNSSKSAQSSTQKISKLLKNTDVVVQFMDNNISYTTIGSDSISSCSFILLIGTIQDIEFSYLSHYPEPYEPPYTPTTTMLQILNIISKNIREHLMKKLSSNLKGKLEISHFTNLHLLVGGGAVEDNDLIRNGLILLNDQNNMENIFHDPLAKHIYQQLKKNVTVLKAVTFLVNNNDGSG
ncbi:unnamed protein product, partial [Adineta steineri]